MKPQHQIGTPCERGNHVWEWPYDAAWGEGPPPDDLRCECGDKRWDQRGTHSRIPVTGEDRS